MPSYLEVQRDEVLDNPQVVRWTLVIGQADAICAEDEDYPIDWKKTNHLNINRSKVERIFEILMEES